MSLRRLPLLALCVVVLAAIAVTTRTTVAPTPAVFSNVAAPWMPAVPLPGGLTSTWFCPGVPAAGAEGAGGSVRVFNTGENAMAGRITVLGVEGDPLTRPVSVPAYGMQEFDLDELVDSPYAAGFVEIDGGGGLVEQVAVDPEGESISACANGTSAEWYVATGDTLDNSVDQIVLTNPSEDAAVVNVTVSTSAGIRRPQALQNFPVPPGSVRLIDVNAVRADESEVGVSVVASRGDVVMGRAQRFDTDARTGYAMTLAAPSLRDQWWFAYGVVDDDVSVSYSVYNPNDADVEVIPFLGGFPGSEGFVPPDPLVVPDGEVVVFNLDDVAGLPDGVVSAVFATSDPEVGIVVERIVTRTIDGVRTTSVAVGATGRPADGYVANTWYVGTGVAEPTENALAVYNITAADAVVTVQAITPDGGVVTVESLAAVELPSSRAVSIDLTDEAVLNAPLIIRSTSPVFVERVVPREPGALGRVAVWAVPANA